MRIFWIFLSLFATFEGLDKMGRVVSLEGELTAINEKDKRVLELHSDVYVGDLLITKESSKGQVRFTDGTIVLLIPGSKYRVHSYSSGFFFSKNRFVATLYNGGIRVTTGLIAQKNPENFELGTPNATIGVRGTNFEVRIVKGEVFAGCSKGMISLTNQEGRLSIGPLRPTQFASVFSKESAPEALKERPDALNASLFAPPEGGLSHEQAGGPSGASINKGC